MERPPVLGLVVRLPGQLHCQHAQVCSDRRCHLFNGPIQSHPPGVNALPSEAGMLARIQAALLEISTSTTMVAR